VKFLFSRSGAIAVAILLLVLFLFRPVVGELRSRIAYSIGNALGRKVTLDNVRLRLLPRPGFDLEGLVIYDDPSFSAEPMIRAQEVSAAIRFRSLLRGRLEMAALSANEPSVNLVRNDEGRWNLSSLLERNAQIPAAQTEKPASERRPAFPYLEASNARVNFKMGQIKKSYALMDADVALWQASANSWSARIKAAPVRTDFNLTDTGQLQINATWQRATSLRLTPLQVEMVWQKGQLGQITKLLTGKDRGWRGGMDLTARLTGTPEALRIESQTTVDGFHRYDIVGTENVRLTGTCSGAYNVVTSALTDVLCESPISGGTLRLRGDSILTEQSPAFDLTLSAGNVPLSSVVRLLRQAKKQIPSDLTASGLLNAEFRATREPRRGSQPPLKTWSGQGSATDVRLSSSSGANREEIVFGTIPLVLMDADSNIKSRQRHPPHEKDAEPDAVHLRVGPIPLAVSAAAPVNAGGWLSSSGYRFFLRGDMELKDLFHLEDVLGLPMSRPSAEGLATLDVNVSGGWRGFAPAIGTGSAQLHNVSAAVRGLNAPLEIGSVVMLISPEALKIEKISARIESTHWAGNMTAPRGCAALGEAPACVFQFDLTADQLSSADLAGWLTPHPDKVPWYRISAADSSSNDSLLASPLRTIQARGRLRVAHFGPKKFSATQLDTEVELGQGKITLSNLHAQLLQGKYQGDWTIDLSNGDASTHDAQTAPVRYHGSGTLQNISLEQVATLMNDAWVSGTGDGNFEIDGSGSNFHDLLVRSDGKLQFVLRNGSLTHLEIPGSSVPLPVRRFAGELRLKKGVWEMDGARLQSREETYQVNGTASPENGLNFEFKRADEQSWMVTGTLAKPRVGPLTRTERKRTEADAKAVNP
jgi:AsmA family